MTSQSRAPVSIAQQPAIRRRLGELLVDAAVLSREQLNTALASQVVVDGRRERLGETVVRLGFVTEAAVGHALAGQLGLAFLEADHLDVDEDVAKLLPPAIAERHRALPLRLDGDTLLVACADPTDVIALDDLRTATGSKQVRPVVVTNSALLAAMSRVYSFEGKATELIDAINVKERDAGPVEEELTADDGPVVRLAESILAQALSMGASDIHVEPGPAQTVVRYRIDGVLHQVMTVPRSKAGALLSRLKLMAGMDIAERRRPQDGRAAFRSGNQAVDLRVSSLPSLNGETIVLRLLRKGAERLALSDLGLPEGDLATVLSVIEQPQGLILITGPTGSGKTSTLYSFLGHLAGESRKIITLEDPVEYELPGVNQTQVNDRIGFTFASALRTVLRQDPDVVMVGEIRDPETAELALQASMTGHLVLSTLHTNSAAGAIVRLRDLGIPGYLLGSSVSLVLAQRLVRRVCTSCSTPVDADEQLLASLYLGQDGGVERLRKGHGCSACASSGYRGRQGVFEIIKVDAGVRELLATSEGESAIRRAARVGGMRTLREDGLRLARAGLTTLDEVLRVTPVDAAQHSCRVCSQEIEPHYARCPWCAVSLRPDACVSCDEPLRAGWQVCPSCGTAVQGSDPHTGG